MICCIAAAFSGCRDNKSDGSKNDLSVVCSVTSITGIAKRLSENTAISIHQIVPDNMNVHTFNLSQKDMKSIQDADLVIIYSRDMEFWADKVHEAKLLVLNDEIEDFEPIYTGKNSVNPHTWLDPVYYDNIARAIADRFSHLNPSAKDSYQSKLKLITEETDKLHKHIKTDAGAGMFEGTYYICSHPSLAYFFRRYDITDVDYIQTGEEDEPSLKHVKGLIEKAKGSKKCIVICEEQIRDKVSDTIIRETGAEKVTFNPQAPYYPDELRTLVNNLAN